MSDTVHYKGRLAPTNKTVKDFCLEKGMKENEEYIDDWFVDNFYKEAIEIEGMVFIVNMSDIYYDDIFEANKNSDGSYSFTVKYYNGGCGFDEAIETALNKLNDGE